uniref:PEAK family member 3 n=1 Tax=Saimiri boliviensis boliviensis TaxID=39432 RepID=A0A2K6UDW5_SAIBB
MSSPEPPTELPEPDDPTGLTQPTYSNLGEVRAHLLPSKACRPRTPGSPSSDPQPLPPPLPQKILTRTQSLPTRRGLHPSSTQVKPPRRPLLGSHSVDESQAEARPAELTFGLAEAPLRLSLRDLHSPEAVLAALAAQQLEGLRAIYVRLRARLMGGHPGPCRPGHGFRLLDSSPCAESGDALYYRVVRVHEEAWHILAAKVPKPGADVPHPWGLELQASLSPHFNLQGLCGLVPEGTLPGAPWRGAVALAAEVPERTVAQWLAEACAQPPEEFAWAVALQLLQLSAALEFLEARGAALSELRPENLLLAAARGCAATCAQPPEEFAWADWLCCEYLAEATESSMGQALALLWD